MTDELQPVLGGLKINPSGAMMSCTKCGRDTRSRRGMCDQCDSHSRIVHYAFRGVLEKNRVWRECIDCGWVGYFAQYVEKNDMRCGDCGSTFIQETDSRQWQSGSRKDQT